MAAETMSSLERWVKTRGALFSNSNYSKRAFNIQLGIGCACLAGGLACFAAPLFGADWHAVFAGFGPGIAGITNIIVPLAIRKRFETVRPVTVPLTSEARSVVAALNRKFQGKNPWAWNSGDWTEEKQMWAGRGNWGWNAYGDPQALTELSDEVLDTLEKAAYQFNRIVALLATSGSGQSSISRLAAKVSTAADEAMAEILHQSGMLGRYPEGADAVRIRLDGAIAELTELANRVQALSVSEPTFTERLATRSGLHDVLDELRMEQAARTELGQARDEQRQNL